MRKITRRLILATILLSGTQCIHLPFTSFSIFQLALIVTSAFALSGFLKARFWKFPFLWAFSSILAYLTSINPSWAKSYLLLGLMSAFIFILIPLYFDKDDFPILAKTLIRSQYIVIPFSVIVYLFFYNVSVFPEKIPLGGGMYISMTEEALDRGVAAGNLRLMLPYATPPVLSIVMTMCLTLLIFSKGLFADNVKTVLCAIFGTILIFTGSRSGIAGLLILFIILFFNGDAKRVIRKIPPLWIVLFIVCGIGICILLADSEYVQKLVIGRFTSLGENSMEEDRHYLVPLDGIILWLSSLKNFFVGIGFGSSLFIKGAHTYLPPYFLNSYVTMLVERGFMGLIILLMLLIHLVRLYRHRYCYDNNVRAFIYMLYTGLFSGLFYESFNCYFLIFALAISFIFRKRTPVIVK